MVLHTYTDPHSNPSLGYFFNLLLFFRMSCLDIKQITYEMCALGVGKTPSSSMLIHALSLRSACTPPVLHPYSGVQIPPSSHLQKLSRRLSQTSQTPSSSSLVSNPPSTK